jgi:hypothetical protein
MGHKPTCAVQKGMSALPQIATAKADFGEPPSLLCPQKPQRALLYLMLMEYPRPKVLDLLPSQRANYFVLDL